MKKNKNSLYKKMVCLISVSILIPLFLVTVFCCYNINKKVNSNFKKVSSNSIARIVVAIKDMNKANKECINMLSEDPNAKDILNHPKDKEWLVKNFGAILESHKSIDSVYMGFKNGNIIMHPKNKHNFNKDFKDTEWYKNSCNNDDIIITTPYKIGNKDSEYKITYGKKVKGKDGNLVGIMGVDTKFERIEKIVKSITIGKSGYVMIVDNNGEIICDRNSNNIGKNINENKELKNIFNNKDEVFEKKYNGIKYMVFKQNEKDTGCRIIGLAPRKELTCELVSSLKSNILITIIALLLAIGGATKFINIELVHPIKNIVKMLNKLSDGDFSFSIKNDEKSIDEIKIIINAINNTKESIVQMIKNISEVSSKLHENSNVLVSITEKSSKVGEEVARAIEQIADGAVSQSEKLNESVQFSENLGKIVEKSLTNSDDMINATENVMNASDMGSKLIKDLSDIFKDTELANLDVVKNVEELNEKYKKVEKITEVIKGITEETNLLALNASIEAARAGELGKGFAVVADEVRKLADQSSDSATEIVKVINEVERGVATVFDKLRYSTKLTSKTGKNITVTQDNFLRIKDSIDILKSNITSVSDGLKEIKNNKDNVIINISEVSAVSEESAATSEEVSASSEEQSSGLQEILASSEQLNELSDKLNNAVEKFSI